MAKLYLLPPDGWRVSQPALLLRYMITTYHQHCIILNYKFSSFTLSCARCSPLSVGQDPTPSDNSDADVRLHTASH